MVGILMYLLLKDILFFTFCDKYDTEKIETKPIEYTRKRLFI